MERFYTAVTLCIIEVYFVERFYTAVTLCIIEVYFVERFYTAVTLCIIEVYFVERFYTAVTLGQSFVDRSCLFYTWLINNVVPSLLDTLCQYCKMGWLLTHHIGSAHKPRY